MTTERTRGSVGVDGTADGDDQHLKRALSNRHIQLLLSLIHI